MNKLSFEEWKSQRVMSDGDYKTVGILISLWGLSLGSYAAGPLVGMTTTVGCMGSGAAVKKANEDRIKREYEEYLNS